MNNIKYYLFWKIKEILVNFFLSFWQFLKTFLIYQNGKNVI